VTFALVRSVADVYWAPVATVVGSLVGGALLLRGLPGLGVRFFVPGDRPRVAALLARGRRLVLFTLLGLVLYNVDLLILRYLRGEADAGRYAAAYVLISFCANLMIALSHGAAVDGARARADAGHCRHHRIGRRGGWLVTMPVAIGGGCLAAHRAALRPRLFRRRDGAAGARAFGAGRGPARDVGGALIARHREPALLRVNITAAVVNVSLNLALIPVFGWLAPRGPRW
jgi:O-antigen/teichoic acid export membrane protein